MIYYSFTLILLAAFKIFESRPKVGVPYYFSLTILFLFTAFRFEVGCDWSNYENQIKSLEYYEINPLERLEVLWWIIADYLSSMQINWIWINVISALLFFIGVQGLSVRQIDPTSFLIFLYPILIVNIGMSALRQAIACGVIMLAFNAFSDKNLIKYLLLVLAATLFHSSAAIFFLISPLVRGDLSKSRLFLALFIAAPVAYILASGQAADTAYERYISSDIEAAGAVFRVTFAASLALIFLLILSKSWRIPFPHDYKLMVICSIIMILIAFVIPFSTVISDRLTYYMVPINAMMVARLPYLNIGRPVRHVLLIYSWSGLILLFVAWMLLSSLFSACYLPYRNWLF